MSLEVQSKIFNRHCNGGKTVHHNFDFNENRYDEDFSEINLETENLCNRLNIIHKKNQKILEQANSLEKKMTKEKKRFSDVKNEFSCQMLPQHAVKLRKKISKNGKLLGKVKLDFDKLEDSLAEIKKEKEVGLFSLKENGKEYLSLTGKWRIFIELLKEKVLDNENLLMGLYEKLSGLRIELASIYEMFEISYLCDDQFLKTVNNTHATIEGLRKDILREIQSARESLENEERNISLHIKEQRRTEETYKEFCCKFQGSYLNSADIEVLLYQNSDLEKKLNDLYSEEVLKNNREKLASKYLDSTEYIKESLKNALNTILSWNKWSYVFPRLVRIEAFPLLRAGVAVFLLLSVFSYLLVYKANSGNIYDYEKGLLALNLSEEKNENGKLDDKIKDMANASEYQKKIDQFNGNTAEELHSVGKINTLQSNSLNIIPSSLLPESDEDIIGDNSEDIAKMNPLWVNYSDIFDDLRFDNPSSAFRLFEIMMNRQTIDLTLMDSIQLLYSIRKVLRTEEGPFFDRLFNDFIKLGLEKKKAASSILHNDKIIEKKYGRDVHYLFKGKLKPIAMLEEMEMKDFEKILVPYIISNYKSFARFKKISVPENVNAYAINLAQDIYICAKKFRVPVTSLLTIVHQESFFINLLGDKGKSASPFQIYQPTKKLILDSMKQDGFKLPENIPDLENHVTFAAYMAAYHFAHLVKSYARPIIDPIFHKPTALIVNLSKSTKFYNGGKYYDKKVMLKQKKLERYLKDKMRKTPLAS